MAHIRLYLIDDHHVVRQAVATMLASVDGLVIVGQSGDAMTGLAEIESLRPNLVMLDLKMPGLSGFAAISRITAIDPAIRIVIFSMYDNPAYVWESVNAGARGYLLKTATRDELIRAVVAVASGSGYLQAEVTMPLLKRFANDARNATTRMSLTFREMQILECLADGLTNKEIAIRLNVSEETVKSHAKNVYEKLGASDRAHAVAIALRQSIIA
jgi:DNA-binding NarL/FixJ family response regulator